MSDGKLEGAKFAFLQAGKIDPAFWASHVNLAGVLHLSSDGTPDSMKQAYALLQNKNPNIRWILFDYFDPALYTGYFRQAVIAFDLERKGEKPDTYLDKHSSEKPDTYSDKVSEDIRKVVGLMESCRSKFLRKFNRNLRHYLDWRIPIAKSMQLSIEVITQPKDQSPNGSNSEKQIPKIEARLSSVTETLESKTDFYSIYNLACTYALFFEVFNEGAYKQRSLTLLKRAFGIARLMDPKLVATYASAVCRDTSFNSLQAEVKSF
ncbi:MAG: hypothetical protein KZQ89_15065 [Candidatus Thiodiazotropha sp. (ex Lucinoma kastoroae)]|nr:hypothetical protein [Candidatus Thiodiazotropha sp. (ex Lucinoma kastoroae)]